MVQRNVSKKAQAVKINITIPLTEVQEKSSPKGNCSDCGRCGKEQSNGAKQTDPTLRMTGSPLLNHAAEALLNMAGGVYSLEELSTALEIIEALLKRHYEKQ